MKPELDDNEHEHETYLSGRSHLFIASSEELTNIRSMKPKVHVGLLYSRRGRLCYGYDTRYMLSQIDEDVRLKHAAFITDW